MRLLFLLLIQLGFSITVFSQSQIKLEGKVLDGVSKKPLSFAYVTLNGVALGTVTNGEGTFKLNIPQVHSDKSIVFSYLGYERQIIAIDALKKMSPLVVSLEKDVTLIEEVVIKPDKSISAKQLLKKVIKNIEENYSQEPVILEGYYRETVAENGAFISYADAAAEIHYAPYQEKSYKWSDYRMEAQSSISSLSNSNMYNGKSLHRAHFHFQTVKDDQAKVIDSRSSKNLTTTDMFANVQCGPMGVFSKDYLKYKAAFFSDKKFKKFNYELGEVLIDGVGYVYVLSFRTALTKELMEELEAKNSYKPYAKAHRNKVLQGKIYIDKESFAVLKFESSVPDEFKEYFCSYTTMNYKHFDYKLNIEYQKIGDKYYLKSLRHEDEFILNDTITNNITPYYAVSQFWVDEVKTEEVKPFDMTEVFANLTTNQLFDLPLEYHEDFWKDYTAKYPIAIIPDSIRKDMEGKTPLEKQFADKHKRNDSLPAPIAKKIPTETKIHKTTLTDDYAWLKQPKDPLRNPDIKEYLVAENEYMDNYFIPLRKSQRELFAELTARLDKEDESIPAEKDGYWYQTKWTEDDEYPIYLRRKEGREEWDTLMNVNVMAKDYDYYSAGGITVSPNTKLMSYYENTTGSDKVMVKFKNLETGLPIKDSLTDVSGILWLNDHQLLYTMQEPKTNRTYRLKLHELNTPQNGDSLLYEEGDYRFQISISKSKSKDYIYMSAGSSNTSEVHFMNVEAVEEGFHLMAPREGTHEYMVTDYAHEFYIISNKDNPNFEVFKCDESAYNKSDWKSFLQPKKGTRLTEFAIFDDFLVLGETENMENRLKVIEKESGKSRYLKIKEDLHMVSLGYNPKFDTDTLQYSISSMKMPGEAWNYNMRTDEKRLVKKQEVKYHYSGRWIKNKRVWAEARDGTKIPITLLYRNWDVNKKNSYKRMYMTSYGSYGAGSESGFNSSIYSLINRGFVYAIAHVRGGGELGQAWHDGGKMMNKKNTFTDFIDCAEFLIEEGYARKGNIVAQGGSAGGLLMGSVVNMRPDLFKFVILDVPFVDVINTMLDDKLPLTTIEYEEWGNPNDKKAFEYMLSYSPYDNVSAQDYPHMLFTTGVNDTRVGYWEPAKMVAKLRDVKTDDNLLLLKTNLSAGHGGGSGRYDRYKDMAYEFAVIFDIFSSDILEEAAEKAAAEKADAKK
ncbi:prolyl oligopeptidase family serine peptidase [Cryomorphaceae bacterium 1068]|nr:prolyl oligopeptidase family serine peptidase [Cryomorphaceae bacterium 1068]